MKGFKFIKHLCRECKTEALDHVLIYNTVTKENINEWYCRLHKPEWNIKYIPQNSFKLFVYKSGTTYIEHCNEQGEINNAA